MAAISMRKSEPSPGKAVRRLVFRSARGPEICLAAVSILSNDMPLIMLVTIGTINVITEKKIAISMMIVSIAAMMSEMGMLYHTPFSPMKRGRMSNKGISSSTWRVSERNIELLTVS